MQYVPQTSPFDRPRMRRARHRCAWLVALCCMASASQAGMTRRPHETSGKGATPSLVKRADFGRERPSPQTSELVRWVMASGDNAGASFVVIDKVRARVYVFEASGKLRGAAPALLGLAKGDDTVPGIGERPLSEIRPDERTTPAGRFVAEAGRNAHGVDVVWVDYDAAVSMHRVLTSNPAEHRLQRLATRTVKDNRISYGCINLPVAFYEKVLSPTVAGGETIVYVLPETRPASAVFGYGNAGRSKPPQTLAQPKPQWQLLDGA